MGKAGTVAISQLIPLLVDTSSDVRERAVWTLRMMGKAGAVAIPPLLSLLSDCSNDVINTSALMMSFRDSGRSLQERVASATAASRVRSTFELYLYRPIAGCFKFR
jgi:HEAT repeat protein